MNGMRNVADFSLRWRSITVGLVLLPASLAVAPAQDPAPAEAPLQQRITALTVAVDRVETQMQQSQRELAELRRQLADLRASAGAPAATVEQPQAAADLSAAVAGVRENEAMQQAQIATLEQTKIESASKYPVKVSGMILMTAAVNTRRVDVADTPTVALSGPGSTAATARQTILGLDATGPHLFGARSFADVRFDFNGSGSAAGYSGYSVAMLRLRTAHAELDWDRTRALFAVDRPALNPGSPSSLIAVAEPALAWSGNLWAWNPQAGFSRDLASIPGGNMRLQVALIDVADPPPLYPAGQNKTYTQPATTELSRFPGIEGRLAYEQPDNENGARLGFSGLFAPHRTSYYPTRFDTWALAADFQVPTGRSMQLSGNVYSGSALGGLGGGAYKDYAAGLINGEFYLKPLDDAGGWVQWHEKAGQRLAFNEAFGIDNVLAHQLRPFASGDPLSYLNLARNRTFIGNIIYSPSASLLFSLEYRRIASSYMMAPTQFADVIGLAAGYKF